MISLHSIIIYFETPTKNRLIMAATLAGFTVLIRPLVIFVIYFSFVALSIHKNRNIPKIIDQSFFVFFGISFMIPFVYYGYGLFVTDFMRWKVPHSFRPYLLTHWEFWKGWFDNGVNVLGHSAIAIATLGFFFIKKRFTQILVIGMSIGYIVFGLVFNYHIMTHSYYQMQFIPIVGICVAPLLENILGSLKKSGNRLFLVPITVVLSLGLYFAYKDVQESLYKPVFEPPSSAKEIGDAINHSSKVVTVAYGYGLPLTYYGEFSGTWWPENEHKLFRHPDEEEGSVQERLKLLGFQPEYFVITNFDRYTRYNKDLQEYLTGNCSILKETDTYLIYTSCKLQNNFY